MTDAQQPLEDHFTPVELRAPEGALQMEVDWADGSTSILPHRWLRGFCPCATCQGHSGRVAYLPETEKGNLSLTEIHEVGLYALRLGWGDGHSTGIYTFRFLRDVGDAVRESSGEPSGMLERTFSR